jgi:hypothetical protein
LKELDKKGMQKVFAVLRRVAHEVSASAMLVRRRAQTIRELTSPCPPVTRFNTAP